MPTNQKPTHRAFVVVPREGSDDFWLEIGAAFPHDDGKGYNLILRALPKDGKIVLREPQEAADPSQQRSRIAQPKSGSRRR